MNEVLSRVHLYALLIVCYSINLNRSVYRDIFGNGAF